MTNDGKVTKAAGRVPAAAWEREAEESGTPIEEARVGPRGFLLIFAFWTLYGAVMAVNLLVSPLRDTSPPVELVAFTYLGAYAWAALTLPVFYLARRLAPGRGRAIRRFAALFGLGIVLSAVVSAVLAVISSYSLQRLVGGTVTGPGGIWEIARYRYLNDLLACLMIIAAGLAWDYFIRYQARQEETSVLRAQLVESRLEVLRTQLNPHFLFNTLNAVSALVAKDPRGVRRMIELLSGMLRYTLEDAPDAEVTVAQEMEILERYLEILEIRYGGRLKTRITSDSDVRDALVPNLILQPLAENAMKHGVGRVGGYGRIEVEARREENDLVLAVRDTGNRGSVAPAPREGRVPRAGGLGLRHTRERLQQLYGDASSITLISDAEGGTLAEIRLPYHTARAIHPGQSIARPSNG